jgi:hypothetical protein
VQGAPSEAQRTDTDFLTGHRDRETARGGFRAALFVAYAARAVVFRDPRQPRKPRPAKPASIIAQVDGSGTAVTEKAFPSIELSADPALPAKSL